MSLLPPANAAAQDLEPSPASDSTVAAMDGDENSIVVEASRQRSTSIDAVTYRIANTTESATLDALQVLDRIPFVSVTKDGQVLLLGRANVAIQVDGNDVLNPAELLGSLKGDQLLEIEVVSNPSARYSAGSSAGVINIKLKHDSAGKLRGTASGSLDTRGSGNLSFAPSFSVGKTSIIGSFTLRRDMQHYGYRTIREPLTAGTAVTEDSQTSAKMQSPFAMLNVTHEFNPAKKLSFSSNFGYSETIRDRDVISAAAGVSKAHREGEAIEFTYGNGSLTYEVGQQTERYLSISSSYSFSDNNALLSVLSEGSDAQHLVSASTETKDAISLDIDFTRQFTDNTRVRAGYSMDRHQENRSNTYSVIPADPSGPSYYAIAGRLDEISGYTDFQFNVAKGHLLAGVRGELRRYVLAYQPSGTLPSYFRVFPSLHFEYPLSSTITLRSSYSRRVSWPGLSDLNLTPRFVDSATVSIGNPALKPEMTDSFEMSAQGRLFGSQVGLTGYWKRIEDQFSSETRLSEGVLISRPVNAGTNISRGLSFSANGKFTSRLSYDASAELFAEHQSFVAPGGGLISNSTVRGGGSLLLQYSEPNSNDPGGDIFAANLSYQSGRTVGLLKVGARTGIDLNWTHNWTDRLSAVASVSDISFKRATRTEYLSLDGTFIQYDFSPGPTFKLSLIYQLASK